MLKSPKAPNCYAGVAQMVEQLIRNQQACGSIPHVGSMKKTGIQAHMLESLFFVVRTNPGKSHLECNHFAYTKTVI